MSLLKDLLVSVRWGSSLTIDDYSIASNMRFLELLGSSYLESKTIYTQNNRISRI